METERVVSLCLDYWLGIESNSHRPRPASRDGCAVATDHNLPERNLGGHCDFFQELCFARADDQNSSCPYSLVTGVF